MPTELTDRIVTQINSIGSRDLRHEFVTQLRIQLKYHNLIANRTRYYSTENLPEDLDTLTAIQILDNQMKLAVYQKNQPLAQLVEQLTEATQQALDHILSQRNAILLATAKLRTENAGLRREIILWEKSLATKIVARKQSWWDYGRWRTTQALDWIGNLSLGGIAKLYVCRQTTALTGMREGIALAVASGVYCMLPTTDFAGETEDENEWQALALQSSYKILNALIVVTSYYGSRRGIQAALSNFPILDERIDIRWHLGTGLSLSLLYAGGMSFSWLLIPLSHTLAMTFKQNQQYRALNHLRADLTPDSTLKYIQPIALVIGIHVLQGVYKAWSRQMTLPLWQSIAFLVGAMGSRYAIKPLLQLGNEELNQANTQFFLYVLSASCGEGLSLLTAHAYRHYLHYSHLAQIAYDATENLELDERITDYTVTSSPAVWSPRFWLNIDTPQLKAAWTRGDGLLHLSTCTVGDIDSYYTPNLDCEYTEIPAVMPRPR